MKKLLVMLTICVAVTGFSSSAHALSYELHNISGSLVNYNDLVHYEFTIDTEQTVWMFTSSYGANGIDAGLILWDANGNLLEAEEDSRVASVTYGDNLGTKNIGLHDAVIEIKLGPGTYTVSMVPMVDGEFVNSVVYSTISGLEQYRSAKGDGKTAEELLAANYFGKEANYAFHVAFSPSTVPIPASALLLAPGLAAIGILRRRQS